MSKLSKDVLERLKAIQARTDITRGVTKEEASTAAALLSRELRKHNLDLFELDYMAQESTITHEVIDSGTPEWKRVLAWVLGKHNGCQVMHFEGDENLRRHSLFVVGEPQNIALVRELYAWLSVEYEKMAQKALEEIKAWTPAADDHESMGLTSYLRLRSIEYEKEESQEQAWFSPGQWLDSYLYGLTQGLDQKMTREREVESSKEQALVPLMSQKAREYIEKTFKYEDVEVNKEITPAMKEGIKRGQETSLTTQVYGAESTLGLEG